MRFVHGYALRKADVKLSFSKLNRKNMVNDGGYAHGVVSAFQYPLLAKNVVAHGMQG